MASEPRPQSTWCFSSQKQWILQSTPMHQRLMHWVTFESWDTRKKVSAREGRTFSQHFTPILTTVILALLWLVYQASTRKDRINSCLEDHHKTIWKVGIRWLMRLKSLISVKCCLFQQRNLDSFSTRFCCYWLLWARLLLKRHRPKLTTQSALIAKQALRCEQQFRIGELQLTLVRTARWSLSAFFLATHMSPNFEDWHLWNLCCHNIES